MIMQTRSIWPPRESERGSLASPGYPQFRPQKDAQDQPTSHRRAPKDPGTLHTAAPDSPAWGTVAPGSPARDPPIRRSPTPGSLAWGRRGLAAGPIGRTWLGARRTRPGAPRSGSAPAAAATAARAPAARAGRVRAPAPCAPRTARSSHPGSRCRSPSSPASSRRPSHPPARRPLSAGAPRPPVPPDAPLCRGAAARPLTLSSTPWRQLPPPTAPARDSPGHRGLRSAS